MARITNASLTARIAALEAQLEMANAVCAEQRATIAAQHDVMVNLSEEATALASRLAVGHQVCRDQRVRIAALEAQRTPTTPVVVAPQPKVTPAPTRSCYYDRKGQLWERTRYSAKHSVSRLISVDEYNAHAQAASDAEVFADPDAFAA